MRQKNEQLPRHVAVIMDGNGRWAKQHSLAVALGHRKGVETLREIVRYASDVGIEATQYLLDDLKARAKRAKLETPESIQQRAAMVLRDVHYVIDAHFDLTENAAPGDNAGKFQDIIKRRLERGQCYSMPYFGTREFPAHFRRCTELPPCPKELEGVRDLGWILLDMDYTDPRNITPRFFRASLTDGVMVVPPWNSEEVRE